MVNVSDATSFVMGYQQEQYQNVNYLQHADYIEVTMFYSSRGLHKGYNFCPEPDKGKEKEVSLCGKFKGG